MHVRCTSWIVVSRLTRSAQTTDPVLGRGSVRFSTMRALPEVVTTESLQVRLPPPLVATVSVATQ